MQRPKYLEVLALSAIRWYYCFIFCLEKVETSMYFLYFGWKFLFMDLYSICRAKRFHIFCMIFVFLFIVAAPNAFEVSEGALPILLFFLDVCPSVFDFSCNLSLVPSTELLWFSLIILEIIWKVCKNIRIKKWIKSDYLSAFLHI